MTQVTAKKSYIKDADGNYIVPFVNPADDDNLGVVKADGSTITSSTGILTAPLATVDFINNSKALETGAVSTNADIYADVRKYAHSTFDLSKFTVVGSPTITNDGIASGFSNSNYCTFTANCGNTTVQIVKFNISTLSSSPVVLVNNTNFNTIIQYVSGSGKHFPLLTVNDGSNSFSLRPSTVNIVANTTYIAKFTYNNSTYELGVYLYDENWNLLDSATNTATNNIVLPTTSQTFNAGKSDNSANLILDLKYLSMTADGIPVFSGNKTDIDTIKDDDYTVVGSPTISDDGIASGFSASNYLTLPYTYSDGVVNYVERVKFTTGSDITTRQPIRGINENVNKGIGITVNSGKVNYRIGTGTSWQQADSIDISTNTTYIVEFTQTSTTSTFKLYSQNGTLLDTQTVTYTNLLYSQIVLGQNKIWGNNSYTGSVDLNAFKIYANGNLVYQPCLKIPYTSSKSGSKVVDSVYRDRVADMYSQFGYSPYYTLSDTDFTLPQGELYGLIGRQTLRKSNVSGINRQFLYSDRTQILTGSCTSGVEVTLPKAFADANYMLSVPYSAKSATAFTPTQTGDWFAIGEGVL